MAGPSVTLPVEHSRDRQIAAARFLEDVRAWMRACIERYADAPPTDVHDQATYTVGWAPVVRALEDKPALAFLRRLRDDIARHHERRGAWHHGYWGRQEVHHGTEHFELFLATLWRLAPGDGETITHFVHATEHVGNWASDVLPWFDPDAGLFRSMYLGTQFVDPRPETGMNVADHFRNVNLCLIAHEMTGEGRYLEVARAHGGRWADAILELGEAPLGLSADGPVQAMGEAQHAAYSEFSGQWSDLSRRIDRAENVLASDGTNALIYLWQRTGEERFRRACEILLDVLAAELGDPDAGPVADAIRTYRRITGSTRYDRQVLDAVADLEPSQVRTMGLTPPPPRSERPAGVGKRQDAPLWLEDGQPRRHSPITLMAAAQIDGDEERMTHALDLARTTFNLARKVYPDGRDHGCAARSVSAAARGHGRDNNAGMVTAVLGEVAGG